MPWPESKSIWVSPSGRTQSGIRRGAVVHLASLSADGETPMVAYGVLRDVGVAPSADILQRGWGCKPVVGGGRGVLCGRGEVVVVRCEGE